MASSVFKKKKKKKWLLLVPFPGLYSYLVKLNFLFLYITISFPYVPMHLLQQQM